MPADLGQFIWPDVAQGRQPQGSVQLKPDFPWAHLWLPSLGYSDLITGYTATQGFGGQGLSPSQNGVAYGKGTGQGDVYFLTDGGPGAAIPQGPMTLVIQGYSLDTAQQATFNYTTTVPVRLFGVYFPANDGKAYIQYGGGTEGSTQISLTPPALSPNDVWVYTVGARGMEIWQNSILLGSNGGNPTRTNSGIDSWGLTLNVGGLITAASRVSFIGLVNSQLSAKEIAALGASPAELYRAVFATPVLLFAAGITGTISRPGSDVSVSGWTFTGASLSASINEATFSDASYAQAAYGVAGGITDLDIPRAPGNHVINFRGEYLTGFATSGQFRFTLMDSSNTSLGVSAWQSVSSSVVQYDVPITISGTATRIKIEIQA